MAARKSTYGVRKSRPMGCAPSHLSFSTGWTAGFWSRPIVRSVAALRTVAMALVLGQELVGSCGCVGEFLVDRLVVEHHRRGPGVSERLPDLGGVGYVWNLDDATRLVGELGVCRIL